MPSPDRASGFSSWELLNLVEQDRTLKAELARQRATPKKQQQEIAYERECDPGAGTVTEGTILKKVRSMERAVRSDLSVLGRGRLVGLPVLQSQRQPVFRRQRNTLSLLAAWDRRHCRSEGARILRRVLRSPGNVSQGRWKRHQSPESDTQLRFGRGVELHLNRNRKELEGQTTISAGTE